MMRQGRKAARRERWAGGDPMQMDHRLRWWQQQVWGPVRRPSLIRSSSWTAAVQQKEASSHKRQRHQQWHQLHRHLRQPLL